MSLVLRATVPLVLAALLWAPPQAARGADLDAAIQRLGSPDRNVVEGAYREIMQTRDAAIMPLTNALSDPSPAVRLHSARIIKGMLTLDPTTITRIHPRMPELLPRMLPALIERFSDPDPEVRRTIPGVIQAALGRTDLDALGGYDPNAALLEALSDPNETVRLNAAATIMVLEGTPDMTRAPDLALLLDAARDESLPVRRTVIAAIANRVENELIGPDPTCVGCDGALPVLKAAMNDPDDAIRVVAAPALALLDPATEGLVPLLITAGSRHVSLLSPLPRDAPERRAPSLMPGTVRRSLIAMMDRGVDVLAELRTLTADPDDKVRATAQEYVDDLGRAR